MDAHPNVRVGVIGAGYWGTFAHIPAVLAHPNATVEAIQNRDRVKAQKVGADFGISHAFTDPDELLAEVPLDAVIVSSTPNVHYAQARAALERGLHVLIEKPMTISADDAADLCRLAEERGVQLLLSSPWHYTAHSIEARRIIRDGEIGDVKMISILMTNPVHELLKGINTTPTHDASRPYMEPERGSYDDPETAGGGQLYCQVTHPAAYLSYLTGARPSQVFAQLDYYAPQRDIYDALTIRLENGTLVNLASTGATPNTRRNYEIRVFGTRGVLFLELWRGEFERVDFEGGEQAFPRLKEDELYPGRAPALNLIDCALGRDINRSPGTLGLASIEVVEAARKSAATGTNIELRK